MYINETELYDIFAEAELEKYMAILRNNLYLFKDGNPIIDIGSGTGNLSLFILENISSANIFAIEPSKTMRTALMSKLMLLKYLDKNITVYPGKVSSFDFPDSIKGVLMIDVIGHINKSERTALWKVLYEKLENEAPIVISNIREFYLELPNDIKLSTKKVGDITYELYLEKKIKKPYFLKWKMRYDFVYRERIINSINFDLMWNDISNQDIKKEMDNSGFGLQLTKENLMIFKKCI